MISIRTLSNKCDFSVPWRWWGGFWPNPQPERSGGRPAVLSERGRILIAPERHDSTAFHISDFLWFFCLLTIKSAMNRDQTGLSKSLTFRKRKRGRERQTDKDNESKKGIKKKVWFTVHFLCKTTSAVPPNIRGTTGEIKTLELEV